MRRLSAAAKPAPEVELPREIGGETRRAIRVGGNEPMTT